MEKFSSTQRRQIIAQAKAEIFDLIVIGGGITGAGILLDAVSRGLNVLLIEKEDFASGTSGKSTKLIHGGLRYLKQFDISLVREVGQERSILHQNARHLVRPRKMLLPIKEGGSISKTMGSIGLWIYDWLADVQSAEKRKMLNKSEALQEEPLFRQEGLNGCGMYWEYITDDARLTIETIKRAHTLGARAINYSMCVGFITEENKLRSIKIQDQINGEKYDVSAEVIVNATGPWLDELNANSMPDYQHQLTLSKGIHAVFKRSRFPLNQSCYFNTHADNRMIFAIPRFNTVYIGTTDDAFSGDLNELSTNQTEIQYLIDACNQTFSGLDLEIDDVISTWAGIRPLIFQEGKEISALSRKDEIFVSENGLISIAGGKLTSYRKMAERAVDKVLDKLKKSPSFNKTIKDCCTQTIKLYGAIFNSEPELMKFKEQCMLSLDALGLDSKIGEELLFKYGAAAQRIIEQTKVFLNNGLNAEEALLKAELLDCLKEEMVLFPADFIVRRSSRIYFHPEKTIMCKSLIISVMADYFGWSQDEILAAKVNLDKAISSIQFKTR